MAELHSFSVTLGALGLYLVASIMAKPQDHSHSLKHGWDDHSTPTLAKLSTHNPQGHFHENHYNSFLSFSKGSTAVCKHLSNI